MKKLVFILSISVLCPIISKAKNKTLYDCSSAKEFITTYNFLTKQEHLELPETQVEKVALEVSKGCKQAAKRFIETFQVLVKSEAGSEASIKYAIKLAQHTDKYQDVFIDIFVSSFSKDQLDLDLSSSIQLASRLSIDFEGDLKTVKNDFKELTEFCLSNHLKLSLAQCGQLSQRVILYSETYKKPVARSFIEAFKYLTENKKINMDKKTALQQAENLLSISPKAFDNFKLTFEFQQKKRSLEESFQLANQIAEHTTYTRSERLPASDQNDQ